MSSSVAFPMYDIDRDNTEALTRAVIALLQERGVAVDDVKPEPPPDDLLAHWQQPGLLLSQTCGYPLMTALPQVQVVGCFHYAAPGCEGLHYRSFLVVRDEDKHCQLADYRHRRAVYNSADSQSGYNALMKRVAPLAVNGHFFSDATASGSHRQSLIRLKQGAGDIAAIDCVTWALLQRHEPQLLAGLSIIDHTPLTPGLPLITGRDTPADRLLAIRDALHTLVSAEHYRAICEGALIQGFSAVTRQPYHALLGWREDAAASGVILR
ncbi:phosphate/phosphite/phosphonate ABC transporter substrate-binding protein [Enterobacter cancerogenus]|uniref:phosphate/phosphite/phosphonate ABC transporter substrate-binding protein n=1 Tax=Enterobacter cancerogenus TaxID=69218 RepID=UPI001C7DD0C8|nr:PhnD/SsuA/transferrin family substrate-binding protein [Enterobacter cancerogenus]